MANGYGSEHAVILPQGEGVQTLQWALQQKDKLRQEKLLREKQQRDQQEGLAKYVDDQLDYKTFATGTVADPVISTGIGDLKKKYASMIKSNPSIGISGLMYDMQQDVSKLTSYSANAKLVRANIEKSLESYKKESGIDPDALAKGALRTAFMKVDPATGQAVVREDIDPTKDYVKDYLEQYPENVITGPEAITSQFDKMKTTREGRVVQTDVKGVKRKYEVSADLLPHEELDIKNGRPVGTKFKTQPLEFSDKTKATGLSEGAYKEFFGSPTTNAVLNMEMKRKHPKMLPGSQDYEATRKVVALDVAKQFRRGGGFTEKDVTDQDVWAGKVQAGVPINSGDAKEKKENTFDVLKNIKKGDLSYIADDTPDENGLINITSGLPGGALFSGKIKKNIDGTASKEAFSNVFYNPETKRFWVQDETKKKGTGKNAGKDTGLVEIKEKDEKKTFQAIAEANGVPVKKFLELWDVKYEDKSGSVMNPVKKLMDFIKKPKDKEEPKKDGPKKKKIVW